MKMFNKSNSYKSAKFEDISTKKTQEIAEKIFILCLTRCCHGNDFKKINNNTKVIARMLLSLMENFMNISHRGGDLGFLEHFSPI